MVPVEETSGGNIPLRSESGQVETPEDLAFVNQIQSTSARSSLVPAQNPAVVSGEEDKKELSPEFLSSIYKEFDRLSRLSLSFVCSDGKSITLTKEEIISLFNGDKVKTRIITQLTNTIQDLEKGLKMEKDCHELVISELDNIKKEREDQLKESSKLKQTLNEKKIKLKDVERREKDQDMKLSQISQSLKATTEKLDLSEKERAKAKEEIHNLDSSWLILKKENRLLKKENDDLAEFKNKACHVQEEMVTEAIQVERERWERLEAEWKSQIKAGDEDLASADRLLEELRQRTFDEKKKMSATISLLHEKVKENVIEIDGLKTELGQLKRESRWSELTLSAKRKMGVDLESPYDAKKVRKNIHVISFSGENEEETTEGEGQCGVVPLVLPKSEIE